MNKIGFIDRLAKTKGLPRVDAKAPLELTVLADDVRAATRKDPKDCAFAKACKRAYHVKGAYFFRTTAWLELDDRLVRYKLPESVQKEIVAFDRGAPMQPGLYRLSRPKKGDTLADIRKRAAKRRQGRKDNPTAKPRGEKKIMHHRTTGIRGDFGYPA